MSSILKALKRLENNTAANGPSTDGDQDRTRQVIRRRARTESGLRPVLLGGLLTVIAVAALFIGFNLKNSGNSTTAPTANVAKTPPATDTAPVVPAERPAESIVTPPVITEAATVEKRKKKKTTEIATVFVGRETSEKRSSPQKTGDLPPTTNGVATAVETTAPGISEKPEVAEEKNSGRTPAVSKAVAMTDKPAADPKRPARLAADHVPAMIETPYTALPAKKQIVRPSAKKALPKKTEARRRNVRNVTTKFTPPTRKPEGPRIYMADMVMSDVSDEMETATEDATFTDREAAVNETEAGRSHTNLPEKHASDLGFVVQALVWSPKPKSRMAMIDNNIRREGDSVNGIRVKYIGEDYLVCEKDGQEWRVWFKSR